MMDVDGKEYYLQDTFPFEGGFATINIFSNTSKPNEVVVAVGLPSGEDNGHVFKHLIIHKEKPAK